MKKKAVVKRKRNVPRARNKELILDKKKTDFLAFYYDPNSETYANAYQSALKAGFTHHYAKTIMSPAVGNTWVKIENYYQNTTLTVQHIIQSAENLALRAKKEETRLKALDFLARIHGMMVEKKITATVNIEELLNDTNKKPEDILDL